MYNKAEATTTRQFYVIAATLYEYYDEILNFYSTRSSNTAARFSNSDIKRLRANFHGVTDNKLFFFRTAKLYGYPRRFSTARK